MASLDVSNKKGAKLYANLPKPTFGKASLMTRSVVKPSKRSIMRPISPEKQN